MENKIRQYTFCFHKANGKSQPMTKENLTIVIDGEPKEGLLLSDLFIKVNKTYDNKVKGFSMLQFAQLKYEENSILYNGIKLEMFNGDGDPVVLTSLDDPFLRETSITEAEEILKHTEAFSDLLTLALPSVILRHNKFLQDKGYKLYEFTALDKEFVFAYKEGEEPFIFFQLDSEIKQANIEEQGEIGGVIAYKTGADFEILFDTVNDKVIVR